MKKITDIQPQQKNKKRVNLFLDDEFFCGLDAFVAASMRLKIGDEVDETRLKEAIAEDESRRAFDKLLSLSAISPRSEKQLRDALYKKEFSAVAVDYALNKAKEYGYINDAEWARMYVESRRGKYGVYALRHGLIEAGVARRIIDELLDYDDTEDAVRAAEKYLRTRNNVSPQKLYAHLYSKGYSSDAAQGAVSRCLDDREDMDY